MIVFDINMIYQSKSKDNSDYFMQLTWLLIISIFFITIFSTFYLFLQLFMIPPNFDVVLHHIVFHGLII
jgi:hypothetical protein